VRERFEREQACIDTEAEWLGWVAGRCTACASAARGGARLRQVRQGLPEN
jgi:hypothetical protein